MTRTVRIELPDPGPASGETDLRSWLSVWHEATAYFASGAGLIVDHSPDRWHQVTVDVSDVVVCFEASLELCDGDADLLERRWTERELLGKRPLGAHLDITLHPAGGHDTEASPHLVGRFLQHWFLAMNLSLPGTFTTYRARWADDATLDPPDLEASCLERAFRHAAERGWPLIQRLPFETTWAWLQRELLYERFIADTALDRALFSLLRICEPNLHDTDRILLIAQALEGLLSPGKEQIGSILRQRLELVLGRPPGTKNWFASFYDLRSRIAHGDYPLRRPGGFEGADIPAVADYITTFFGPTDQAIAILVALLQDLARAGASNYTFSQVVARQ